jgi:lipopolysaccharide biosynthesis glycosyltransferase
MLHHIVMACDETYAVPLATALRSVVDSSRSGQPLDVHVLYDQFSARSRQRVADSLPKSSALIRWEPVDLSAFERFPTLPHISSKMTFARFVIPQIFPAEVRRVLYLDADTLVLDDLGPLWEADLKGAVMGAVLDRILDPQIKACAAGLEQYPRVQNYFNAGVLLIDLERWRQERVSERALEYLIGRPNSPLADQDALNVACDGRWLELGARWNYYDHFRTVILEMPLAERPVIAHFPGQKPWKASSLSVNAELYEGFRRKTRFARTKPERLLDRGISGWCRLKRRLRGTSFGRAVRRVRCVVLA